MLSPELRYEARIKELEDENERLRALSEQYLEERRWEEAEVKRLKELCDNCPAYKQVWPL